MPGKTLKNISYNASGSGFSSIDLLVLLAAISVLAMIVIVPASTVRKRSRMAVCSENLHEIGKMIGMYSEDHNRKLPGIQPGAQGDLWWWYKEQINGYLTTSSSSKQSQLFACPNDRGYSDSKPFWATPRFDYGSYVYNGVTMPGAPNIAGWPVSAISEPRRTLLVMEWTAHAPLSWHNSKTARRNAPFYPNAESMVAFVDGHVNFTKIFYDGYTAAYLRDPVPGYDYRYSGH